MVHMKIFNKKALWLLLVGDMAVFVATLWLALFFRHFEMPSPVSFQAHLAPFSLLFGSWILIFFISGLYDKESVIFRSRLPSLLVRVQVANILLAVAFFYFIPWFGISPKSVLFVYLFLSLALIILWRLYGYFTLIPHTTESAVIVGSGEEMAELVREVNDHSRYNIRFSSVIDLADGKDVRSEISAKVDGEGVSVIAVDLRSEKLSAIMPSLYGFLFSKIRFVDMNSVYEDVFNRVPISIIGHAWFLENVSTVPKFIYDTLKRIMDVCISATIGLASLVFYPFVALAIKLEDRGPVFVVQERVGKNGKVIRIAKFRSMSVAAQSEDGSSRPQSVTRIGAFIRKTRIDELPQLWSVIKGDLSLIGPRPELVPFVDLYSKQIPFYDIRHLIKPGLSGWAQLYHKTPPKFSVGTEETRAKLSYDLFYIKNRSFTLDLTIALKTVKELVMRKGV